jgi:ribosomal protein L5
MNITIVTSTSSDSEAYSLLKMFGLPLREKPKNLDKSEAA